MKITIPPYRIIRDYLKSFFVFMTVFFTSINTLCSTICRYFGINAHSVTVMLAMIIYGMLVFFAITSIIQMPSQVALYVIFMAFCYLFSLLVFPNNRDYLLGERAKLYFWIRGIPALIVSSTVKEKKIMYSVLYKLSFVVVAAQAFISIVVHMGVTWYDRSNYMEVSYQLLLPAVLFLLKKDKKKIDWLFMIVAIFIIVFEGARWTVFGVAACILYIIVKNLDKLRYKLLLSVIVVFCAFIILNLNYVIDSFLGFAQLHNLQGHFVRTLRAGRLFETDRIDYYDIIFGMLKSNPFGGYGLGADRYYLNGSYAHNIAIEIIFDFGIILGFIVMVFIIHSIIKLMAIEDYYYRSISLSLIFSMGLFKLILSSSFLEETSFFVLMGLALAVETNTLETSKIMNLKRCLKI